MASRSFEELIPEVREKLRLWLEAAHRRGIEVVVTCTYRSPKEQASLYLIGRLPGDQRKPVTYAPAWRSWHNYRRAWDAYPLVGGKVAWSYDDHKELYDALGAEAQALGIEWGGYWHKLKDYGHYQVTGGLSFERARELLDQQLA